MRNIDQEIFDALRVICESRTWQKSVREDFLLDGDTQLLPHEVPFIQISDDGYEAQHLRGRVEVFQRITIEIWGQTTTSVQVNQSKMREWRQDLEQALGAEVNLGIKGALHFQYTGGTGPIRIRDNIYLLALFLEFRYYKPFVGAC